ncbi:MAG: hypothetical protein WAK55_14485, partial [Xanthobacteraceae bacterium]
VTPAERESVGFPLHVILIVEAASASVNVPKTSEQTQATARRLGILAIDKSSKVKVSSPRAST